MGIAELLILGLATWRVAVMAAEEDGPFGAFEWIRDKIGVRHDEVGDAYGTNEVARAVLCVWCSSPLWGALWTALWLAAPGAALAAAAPFALSAVALIVHGRGVRHRKRVL